MLNFIAMNLLHLKNSIRFLLKKKSYLLINVFGLGIGIAAFLIVFLYVHNEFTYNYFNRNLANIYRVCEGTGIATKGLLLPKLLEQVPEVENGTRISATRERNGKCSRWLIFSQKRKTCRIGITFR